MKVSFPIPLYLTIHTSLLLSHLSALLLRKKAVMKCFLSHHRAANENRIEVIKALLRLGAQIDIKANDNCTPFLMAVAAGSVESAQLLRESGADVHASTSDIKNCLHLAVDNGHLELLQHLLEDKKTSENLYKSDARERVPLHDAATSPNIKVSISNFFFSSYSRSFIAGFPGCKSWRFEMC